MTQCRQVLGHKGSNALITEPFVAPNGRELVAPNGRKEEVQGSTPCCAELVSFGEMMSMVWDTKRKMGRMAQKILS